jgi:GH25 family lysozyme M1 (1,4-beta-N-acetylmuramidase)
MTAAALALAFGTGDAIAQRPLGVDVSDHQPTTIDWSSVKNAGYSFAWAKATQGLASKGYPPDDTFVENEQNGKAAGVYIGAYHFAQPNIDSPGSEAAFFWSIANPYINADGKTFMPMLDFEVFSGHVSASSYSDWANQWCDDILADAAGKGVTLRPFIYTTACWGCNFDSSVAQWLSDIANPDNANPQTGTPWTACSSCDVWGSGVWGVWQYDWNGSVPGITEIVDLDVCNGTLASMVSTMVVHNPDPAVIVMPSGDMQVFAVDLNTQVYANTQTSPDGSWNGFGSTPLGGANNTKITGTLSYNGHQEMFVIGTDNKAYHDYFNGTSWSGWSASMGTRQFSQICALLNTTGTEEVFGIGYPAGDVWTITQSSPGAGWGSTWTSLGGGGNTRIAAVVGHDGQQEVYVAGNGKTVQEKHWNAATSSWTGWGVVGTSGQATDEMCAILNSNGDKELFVIDPNGAVWTATQISPGAQWGSSTWVSLGGTQLQRVAAVSQQNGNAQVVVLGGDGSVFTKAYSGSSWPSNWTDLGGTQRSLAVAKNTDGKEIIFGVGSDANNSIFYLEQTAPNGGWGVWTSMGGSFE